MTDYKIEEAIVDFGFIDGYIRNNAMSDDDGAFEWVLEILDDIRHCIIDLNVSKTEPREFLFKIGFIRGAVWEKPLPNAVCEKLDRITRYCVNNRKLAFEMTDEPEPEPKEDRLSEADRDRIMNNAENAVDTSTAEYAQQLGRTPAAIDLFWRRILGDDYLEQSEAPAQTTAPITSPPPPSPSPEPEAAPEPLPAPSAAVPPPAPSADPTPVTLAQECQPAPDADGLVAKIRELSDTMTDDEIAGELDVSRDTVIRRRHENGIEKDKGPRDGHTRHEYQWAPEKKQMLIDMKLAGKSWGEIAEAVGKTRSQCSGIWFWEKRNLAS